MPWLFEGIWYAWNINEKQIQLINDLANDFKPVVREIESGIKTTQNNYGRYGGLIAQLSKGDKGVANIIALALIKAGANSLGVNNGLKLFV